MSGGEWRCAGCQLAIGEAEEYLSVPASPENPAESPELHFHARCFNCEVCRTPCAGEFVPDVWFYDTALAAGQNGYKAGPPAATERFLYCPACHVDMYARYERFMLSGSSAAQQGAQQGQETQQSQPGGTQDDDDEPPPPPPEWDSDGDDDGAAPPYPEQPTEANNSASSAAKSAPQFGEFAASQQTLQNVTLAQLHSGAGGLGSLVNNNTSLPSQSQRAQQYNGASTVLEKLSAIERPVDEPAPPVPPFEEDDGDESNPNANANANANTGELETLSGSCVQCGGPVGVGDDSLEDALVIEGNLWHSRCLHCSGCGQRMMVGDEMVAVDLSTDSVVEINHFHVGCMMCQFCRSPIGREDYALDANNSIQCVNCHEAGFAEGDNSANADGTGVATSASQQQQLNEQTSLPVMPSAPEISGHQYMARPPEAVVAGMANMAAASAAGKTSANSQRFSQNVQRLDISKHNVYTAQGAEYGSASLAAAMATAALESGEMEYKRFPTAAASAAANSASSDASGASGASGANAAGMQASDANSGPPSGGFMGPPSQPTDSSQSIGAGVVSATHMNAPAAARSSTNQAANLQKKKSSGWLSRFKSVRHKGDKKGGSAGFDTRKDGPSDFVWGSGSTGELPTTQNAASTVPVSEMQRKMHKPGSALTPSGSHSDLNVIGDGPKPGVSVYASKSDHPTLLNQADSHATLGVDINLQHNQHHVLAGLRMQLNLLNDAMEKQRKENDEQQALLDNFTNLRDRLEEEKSALTQHLGELEAANPELARGNTMTYRPAVSDPSRR
jgi:hypothetical protein